MLRGPEEAPEGRVVYLYPQTRTASRTCHAMKAVTVVHAKRWPMVVVKWTEGRVDKWELVHKDNIRLRPPSARVKKDEKEGDTVQGTGMDSRWARPRKMAGRVKPIDIPDDQEQGTLF